MTENIRTKSFWLSVVLSTIIFFLSILNFSHTFISTTDIIILSKSPKAASEIGSIVDNVKAIPLTLSFYDRMRAENEDISDEAAEFSDAKRSSFWNSKIKTERIGNSSIVRIAIIDKNMYEVQTLADQTKSDLINQISSYYDIKNDIDIRVIDGPKIKESSKYALPLMIILSMLFGLALTFTSFALINPHRSGPLQLKMKDRPKELFTTERKPAIEIKEEKLDFSHKPEIISQLKQEKDPTSFKEKPAYSSKTASAPGNLPVADVPDFLKTVGMNAVNLDDARNIPQRGELKINSNEPIGPDDREATPEEVKERLNKLLSGSFNGF